MTALAPARSLVSLDDLTDADLEAIIDRGVEHGCNAVPEQAKLSGLVLATMFLKTSTRTRTAFTSAALRLGAQVIAFGPDDLQLNTGETVEDTARVLGAMIDGVVARTASDPADLRAMASNGLPVVNAMSADEHPTQALADLSTIKRRFGRLDHLRVLYLGEGNNTATALARGLTRFPGTEVHVRCPAGFGLDAHTVEVATEQAAAHQATFEHSCTTETLPEDVDIVYTTRWQTTGTAKSDPDWRQAFAPFHVAQRLMDTWPNAVLMHDLPAHRGEEVAGEVLDGPRCIAFEQAWMKERSARAVLEWTFIA